MRYMWVGLIAAFLAVPFTVWAETPDREASEGRISVRNWGAPEADGSSAPIRMAQAADRASEVPEGNIFDQIKIELLDLQELGREMEELLSGETIRLDLDQCVRMALDANHDILIVAYEPLKSDADLMVAKGEFDPLVTGNLNYSYSEQSASAQIIAFSQVRTVENYSSRGDISLGGKLRWGTQYNVRFNVNREQGTFSGFFEDFSGGVSVSLTQPVLRGMGKRANLARIRSARNLRGVSEAQVELTVLNAIGEVINAYWDLVGTVESLKVREESLANAERLAEINQRRLEIGTAAAIEVLQAKAGVAMRQSDFITARTAIADAEDRLKGLLGMRDGELFSSKRIVPTSRPGMKDFEWNEERSMHKALDRRPEMRRARLEIENAIIEEKRVRNGLLPQLDLSASYNRAGRGLELGRVFDGVREEQDRIYSFGITGSVPIGNRAGRGNYQRARLLVRQAEQRFRQSRQNVMMGVRVAARGVLTSEILVESNRQARILQEANVAAEEKRLRIGVTTSYRVLQIQEDLTAAQTQEVQSKINFEKSLVEIQVAEGALLENLGIEYEAPDAPGPVSFLHTVNPVQVWKTFLD